jgi:hypothetical protein
MAWRADNKSSHALSHNARLARARWTSVSACASSAFASSASAASSRVGANAAAGGAAAEGPATSLEGTAQPASNSPKMARQRCEVSSIYDTLSRKNSNVNEEPHINGPEAPAVVRGGVDLYNFVLQRRV